MDYSDIIKRVWSEISEGGLPPELHEIAFREGVRFYTQTHPATSRIPPQGSQDGSTDAIHAEKPRRTDPDPFTLLSTEAGTPKEHIDEVFYFNPDGTPAINLSTRRLGKSNAERTRTIAILLATARHFANDEMEVPVADIREVCQQLNVYDSNNFSGYLSNVPGFLLSGPRTNRVLRPKADVAARFKQRVAEIVGATENE